MYGGCWLDATVLLTGRISERYWEQDFFCFRETIQNAIKNIGKMHLLIITGGVRSLKLKC